MEKVIAPDDFLLHCPMIYANKLMTILLPGDDLSGVTCSYLGWNKKHALF